MESGYTVDKVLDLRGWSCPWCIVKAKSWLRRMEPGQVLEVLTTDPEAQGNFNNALRTGSDRVMAFRKHPEHFQLLIRHG